MLILRYYFIIFLIYDVTIAYKSGAPASMCASMMPHHKGAIPQQLKSPYDIQPSTLNTKDGRISLKLTGEPFLGVLVEGRRNPDQPGAIGSFLNLPNSLKTMTCDNYTNSAVTHKDNSKKENLEFDWMAPSGFEGEITFIATVVKNYSTFWTGILSPSVQVEKFISDDKNFENNIKSDLYEGCNIRKDCLGFPQGCLDQRDCMTVINVISSDNELNFEMMSLDSKYVAVGISEDKKMGGDYVAECVLEADSVKAYESWNVPNRKENIRLPARDNLKLLNGEYENGNIYCSLKIPSDTIQLENFILDLNRNRYYILLASGKEVKLEEGSTKTSGVAFHDNGYLSSENVLMTYIKPDKINDPFYDGCNVEMNCFGVPDNCIKDQNCKLVVSILTEGTKYRFRLKGEAKSYIAVGLSDDDKMGGDSVMECVNTGRNIVAYMSWNKPGAKANTREGISQTGLKLINGNTTNGVIYCEFTRETVTVVEQKTFDLMNNKYIILLASGSSLKENSVGFHDLIYTASGEKRYLSDVRQLKTADRLLVRLHGAFMIAAWIGTTSIGIVFARYFKQTWVDSSLCSKDLWFAWHRFFMLMTWCLTITGCALIVVDVGDWVPEGSQRHAILGVITVVLCFIQPIGAAFRPHPTARLRPIFNWLHWLIGNSAHIVSIVTIFFAVPLAKAQLPEWVNWILVAFVAFYVLIHVIFSFAGCLSERRALKKINAFPMKEMNTNRGNLNNIERKQDAPMAGFRKLMLFIHMVYITGLTAALIVIVVLAPIGTQWQTLQNKFMGM
ncbi:hypothetical protein O3M35_004571 [Rhynocoris fuscipes]|uniref:Ferric-chelate reductase 1 n=1 Tax=Rhynocoris fuscipes TaxID=488301 RepID=A0AAW1CEV1_9HEMI